MRTIELRYKCSCMTSEVSLQMREREPGQDVLAWMAAVQAALGEDHARRSPFCQSRATEYLKIPLETDRVGEAKGGNA